MNALLSKRDKLWTCLLVSLVAGQLLISLFLRRGSALTISSDIIQDILLLLACTSFAWNVYRSPARSRQRLFWMLMSLGMALWLAYQGMWNYFEVILRKDVPVIFGGDIVLFLHLVPMIAAVALRPHARDGDPGAPLGMLDFALLLIWWGFLYVYYVIPWQYIEPNQQAYGNNYNQVYLTEKIVLLGILSYGVITSRGRWRQLYGQFLAAITLYACSSYVANWAIGRSLYYSGSIYDIPLILSVAWLAVIGKFGRGDFSTESDERSQPLLAVWITRLAMLGVFTLPCFAILSEFQVSSSEPVRMFRVALCLMTLVIMGAMVFVRQRLLGIELARLLGSSRKAYKELQDLQEQLMHSEKLASVGRLVAGAAHEINNPLSAMLGYSELLTGSELPPQERSLAFAVHQQVRRTRELVANLLSFASQSPARISSVDLNSLVETAVRLLRLQLDARAISTRIDQDPQLPAITADSSQVLRVVLHLAAQICSQKKQDAPTSLNIETLGQSEMAVLQLSCGARVEGERTWIVVGQNGVDSGSLSLSACRRIVSDHGGRIFMEQTSEGSIAFRIEFPASAKSVATATNLAAVPAVASVRS